MKPQRIVSLVPSITELLADLGLEEEVVGITRFCVHPREWKEHKTIVGGTKNVRVNRVRQLRPTLVIANKEENVREQVEEIAGFAEVLVTDVETVAGAIEMIRDVGAAVGRGPEAEAIVSEIEERFDLLSAAAVIPAAYLIWKRPFMTVGGDTFISDVMERAGIANVFGEMTRYPEVTPADLVAAGAEVVLLSSEPYPFDESDAAELAAELDGRSVILVDGERFSWYGSRMRLMPPYLRELRARLAT